MTSRQASGDRRVMSGSSRDTPALAIHTSMPPNRSVIRSATVSLNRSSRTSPGQTRWSPVELARHPVEGGLGPGDQGEPRAGGVEGAGQHAAEAAPGAGDHHAPPGQSAEPVGGTAVRCLRPGPLVFHGHR